MQEQASRAVHIATSRAAGLRRRWVESRSPRRSVAIGVVLGLVLPAVTWALANDSLTSWLVALGMDQERGLLLAAGLAVVVGAALGTAVIGRPGPVRCGAVVAMVAIQVGPFLVRAAQAGPTPGLVARPDIREWVVQPLGMVLLGAVAATVGAAAGALLRHDAIALLSLLRRQRLTALPLVVVAGLVIVGASAAATALQTGPLSGLYQYGTGAPAGGAAITAGPGAGNGSRAGGVSGGLTLADRRMPGHLSQLVLDRHPVYVYLPGAYAQVAGHHYPVVYFLHGFPNGADQWSRAGQLVGVLDQLIASSQVAPLIAVMPDGNGSVFGDSEWGNTVKGDRVESWVVDRLVPQIDALYRTLGATYRGIAGPSSGGFGALNVAARHPDVFRWAASYSGYVSARTVLFGAQSAANSPALTLPALPAAQRMALFLGAGRQDGQYLVDTQALASALQRVGWGQLRTSTVPGGHSWEVFRPLTVQSLQWLGRLWGLDPGAAVVAAAGQAATATAPHRGCGGVCRG